MRLRWDTGACSDPPFVAACHNGHTRLDQNSGAHDALTHPFQTISLIPAIVPEKASGSRGSRFSTSPKLVIPSPNPIPQISPNPLILNP